MVTHGSSAREASTFRRLVLPALVLGLVLPTALIFEKPKLLFILAVIVIGGRLIGWSRRRDRWHLVVRGILV